MDGAFGSRHRGGPLPSPRSGKEGRKLRLFRPCRRPINLSVRDL